MTAKRQGNYFNVCEVGLAASCIAGIYDADRRKLRVLWIGAGLYFLILLNGLRFFSQLPYQIVINAMIFTAMFVNIRRVHKRIGSEAQNTTPTVAPNVTTPAKPRNIRVLWLGAGLYFVAMLIPPCQHL
jgi:hypothetical protein